MDQEAASLATNTGANRRRFPRLPLGVPVDIVVLRSGIPQTIPGRSLDISEGGVAVALAGEVLSGEVVGIEMQLPSALEPVEAKAIVCHYGALRCGLQFLGMPLEQSGALRAWVGLRAAALGVPQTTLAPPPVPEPAAPAPVPAPPAAVARPPVLVPRSRSRLRRWGWIAIAAVLLIAALGWWSWHRGWKELEQHSTTASYRQRIFVPSSAMEPNLVHRVEPVYPPEAMNARLQGLVRLDTVIGTDGAVIEMHPRSGPELLAQAAMDAVRWWRYQPYRVNGEPVEVQTTIEVDFRLTP